MSPKEKAEELFNMFWSVGYDGEEDGDTVMNKREAKKCCQIAVDQLVIEANDKIYKIGRNGLSDYEYWIEVRKELQNY